MSRWHGRARRPERVVWVRRPWLWSFVAVADSLLGRGRAPVSLFADCASRARFEDQLEAAREEADVADRRPGCAQEA